MAGTPAAGGDEPTVTLPAVELGPPTAQMDISAPGAAGTALPPWAYDDDDDEWQVTTPSNRVKMRLPTAILLGLLLAAGAFWGGAAVQRAHGSSSGFGALANAAARLRGSASARGASGAAGGFTSLFGGGGGAAPTEGTVTEVQGSTIYLTNAAGNIVTVKLSPSATITRTANAKPTDLQLGDTVIVEGSTAKNGTVTATSVSATAPGVSTTGGRAGFGARTGTGG